MKNYRITKYNPKLRDKNGIYSNEEWTEFSDIGKSFKGKIFQYSDYKYMEDNFVKLLKIIFIDSSKNKYFTLNNFSPFLCHFNFDFNILSNHKDFLEYVIFLKENISKFDDIDIDKIILSIIDNKTKKFTYFGPDFENTFQVVLGDKIKIKNSAFEPLLRLILRYGLEGGYFLGFSNSYIKVYYDSYLYIKCINGVIDDKIINKYNKHGIYIEEQ